jgi:hypothetical protein
MGRILQVSYDDMKIDESTGSLSVRNRNCGLILPVMCSENDDVFQ